MKAATPTGRERGMVLVTSLIILLVLTLLGLASMQNTQLEERMAGNFRAQNVAFQAAEAGLRAGETWLGGLVNQPGVATSAPGSNQVWAFGAPDPNATNALNWYREPTRDRAWWLGSGIAYADVSRLLFTGTQPIDQAPRRVIEQAGFVADSLVIGQQQNMAGRWFYQLTGRGEAPGGRGEAMLRSTFARRF